MVQRLLGRLDGPSRPRNTRRRGIAASDVRWRRNGCTHRSQEDRHRSVPAPPTGRNESSHGASRAAIADSDGECVVPAGGQT